MESIGLTPQELGKDDESQTIRFRTWCDSQRESTTELAGSSPIFAVPWQCDDPSAVAGPNRNCRQSAAWDGSLNQGVSSGGSGSSEGRRTSFAPAANITPTLFSAASASRSR